MFFRGKEIPISESDYVSVAMPPVIDKPFGEMTKKEALSIFAWFMENLDARIHNMCVYLQFEGDYTPESLIPLWDCVMKSYKTKPVEEFYTIKTCIGLYLAETLRHQYPQLKWECQLKGRKDLIEKNRPVLKGFYLENGVSVGFEPAFVLQIQSQRLYDDEADKEQLIRVFEKWANKIPGVVVKSPREDPRKHKGRFVIMDDSGKKEPIVYDELPEWLLR